MIGYVKHFDSNKTMSFKVNDNRLLKKYSKIWEKVSILMNIEFDKGNKSLIVYVNYALLGFYLYWFYCIDRSTNKKISLREHLVINLCDWLIHDCFLYKKPFK